MKKCDFEIYTDGACSGNPGPGGYGIVIIQDEIIQEMGGYEKNTTNNRMELTAVIKALNVIYEKYGSSKIKLISDSTYVVNAIQKRWLNSWASRNYCKADGSPIPNADLWRAFSDIYKKHNAVKFEWVRGHSGNKYNERCDRIAVGCIKGCIDNYSTF